MIAILVFALVVAATSQQPPRPQIPARLLAKATSTADVPVSEVALVTWMMQGPADAPSELLFVVWRGQPGWYRGPRQASSGGSSANRFSASGSYGGVQVEVDFDGSQRIATVQGTRVEMRDDNVILVDGVDHPGGARVVKTMRVAHTGERQPGPAGPVRALGASPEILGYIGCAATPRGTPAGFCKYVVGNGEQD